MVNIYNSTLVQKRTQTGPNVCGCPTDWSRADRYRASRSWKSAKRKQQQHTLSQWNIFCMHMWWWWNCTQTKRGWMILRSLWVQERSSSTALKRLNFSLEMVVSINPASVFSSGWIRARVQQYVHIFADSYAHVHARVWGSTLTSKVVRSRPRLRLQKTRSFRFEQHGHTAQKWEQWFPLTCTYDFRLFHCLRVHENCMFWVFSFLFQTLFSFSAGHASSFANKTIQSRRICFASLCLAQISPENCGFWVLYPKK